MVGVSSSTTDLVNSYSDSSTLNEATSSRSDFVLRDGLEWSKICAAVVAVVCAWEFTRFFGVRYLPGSRVQRG